MFKPIEGTTPRRMLTLTVDGREITAFEGDTLAMALLAAGISTFRRTPVSGAPRAPLCMMGVCFDCIVNVDGRRNVQSCMIEVKDGMKVGLPAGANRVEGVA